MRENIHCIDSKTNHEGGELGDGVGGVYMGRSRCVSTAQESG